MIDWMTLRLPWYSAPESVRKRLVDCMGAVISYNPKGEAVWEKLTIQPEHLGSDLQGLYIAKVDSGKEFYFQIGASPASIEHHGLNTFGSLDIQHCANVLLSHLSSVFPHDHWPNLWSWDLRRLDVTFNYLLASFSQVKEALHLLLSTNAPRRSPYSKGNGGDSVYWRGQLISGKGYHKGPQLRAMKRDAEKKQIKYRALNKALETEGKPHEHFLSHKETIALAFDDRKIDMCDRILRLEMQINSAWFRANTQSVDSLEGDFHGWQLGKKIGFLESLAQPSGRLVWQNFTPEFLTGLHRKYFSAIIGSDKVVNNMDNLLEQLESVYLKKKGQMVQITPAQALAAHNTFLAIEKYGFEQVKARALDKGVSTFYRHIAILKAAGLSSADLSAGKILPLRAENHLCLSSPVMDWQQLEFLVLDSASNECCYPESDEFQQAA